MAQVLGQEIQVRPEPNDVGASEGPLNVAGCRFRLPSVRLVTLTDSHRT